MIYHGLPFGGYLDLPGWNWSRIKHMTDSPRHVRHAADTPDVDTASRAWLRAVHCLVLEPARLDEDFAVFDGTRRGRVYDSFVACNPGRTVLRPQDLASAMETAAAIREHPVAAGLLAEGEAEVSMTWVDPSTGLTCKGRADWVGPRGLVDLKNLGSTSERAVSAAVARGQYHGQLAHYVAGLEANGVEVPAAYLVVAEGRGAQDVAVFRLDAAPPDGALYAGHRLRERYLAQLAECVQSGRWPGRHEAVQDLVLPNYALDEEIFTSEP